MANNPILEILSISNKHKNPISDRFDQGSKTVNVKNTNRDIVSEPSIRDKISKLLNPDLSGLPKRSLKEDVIGVAQGATLGVPAKILEMTTGKKIPEGSKAGRLVGSFVGFSKLAQLPSLIKLLAGRGIAKGATRGAIAGAFGANAPILDNGEVSPTTRAFRTAIGATMGAAAEPLFSVGVPIASRIIRKSIKQVEPALERVKRLKKLITTEKKIKISNTKQRINEINEMIDDVITKRSREGAVQAQRDIRQSIRNGKRQYEQRLDDIANRLNKSTESISAQEVIDSIDDSIQEINTLFIDEGGMPFRTLNKIREMFLKKIESGGGMQVVELKEVLNAKKSVFGAVSSSARGGSAEFTQDDIVAAIFNKNIGKIITKRAGKEFSELQSSYSEFVDRIKDGHRLFKIGKPSTMANTKLVERAARQSADPGEIEAIRRLEKAGDLKTEIRPITGGAERAFKEKIRRNEEAQSLISDIENNYINRLSRLESRERYIKQLQRLKSGRIRLVTKAGQVIGGVGATIYLLKQLKNIISNDESTKGSNDQF